ILFDEPTPPRAIDRSIPRDLETIVLKCLAKDPKDRYAAAAEVADDLKAFLADRPIKARRASRLERAWRWCRRNRAVAGLSAAVLLLLVALGIGAAVLLPHLNRDPSSGKGSELDENEVGADPGYLKGFPGRIGRSYVFQVIGVGPGSRARVIWGTDVYTD